MRLTDFIRFYAATDVGKVRDHNEDNFLVDKKLSLFIVADGMGGHAAGEVASAIAVRTVHEEMKREKELLDDYAVGRDRREQGHDEGHRRPPRARGAARVLRRSTRRRGPTPAKRGMGTTL